MWNKKAMGKKNIEAITTNFQKILLKECLESIIRNFCSHGLTYLDATLTLKHHSET